MSETTIAQPLSAQEIVEDICDKVRQSLYRDCHLNPSLAYESYSGSVDVKVKLQDCGRAPETQTHVEFGTKVQPSEETALEHAELTILGRPPNQVRQESGQPLPTLVTDSEGRQTVKPVRYQRKPGIVERVADGIREAFKASDETPEL